MPRVSAQVVVVRAPGTGILVKYNSFFYFFLFYLRAITLDFVLQYLFLLCEPSVVQASFFSSPDITTYIVSPCSTCNSICGPAAGSRERRDTE